MFTHVIRMFCSIMAACNNISTINMNSHISTFVGWIEQHDPVLQFKLNGPAAQSDIDKCESRLGVELPATLRDIYLRFDGQDWSSRNGIFYDYSLLPLSRLGHPLEEEAIPSREELLLDGLWVNDTVKPYTLYNKWLAFGDDHGGLCLSLDYDPGINGRHGQIISNGADDTDNEVVADCFDNFFTWYLERLSSGEYYIGEPFGIYDEPHTEFRVKRGTHFIEMFPDIRSNKAHD